MAVERLGDSFDLKEFHRVILKIGNAPLNTVYKNIQAWIQEQEHRCEKSEDTLRDLVSEFFSWRLEESPEYGTKYGVYSHEDKVEEYSEEAFERRIVKANEFLQRVMFLQNKKCYDMLTDQGQITLNVLDSLLRNFIDGYQFRWHAAYTPFITFGGPTSEWSSVLSQMKKNTVSDYENIIARLYRFPDQLKNYTTLMRKAIAIGTTQYGASLVAGMGQLEDLLNTTANNTFFMEIFHDVPTSFGTRGNQLRAEALSVVQLGILPAVRDIYNFMKNEYLPNARSEAGVWSLPNGTEFYNQCLYWHLSVNLTADEVHQMGLDEVARIRKQMEKIQQEDGIPGTLKDYRGWLLNQSKFYYPSEEAFLDGAKAIVDKAKSKLPAILDYAPPGELEIKKLPNPHGPTGRYSEPPLDGSRAGITWVNVWYPETKPKYDLISLMLHEAIPGHHTQTSYAIAENITSFRRAIEFRKYHAVPFNWLFFTSYSEGWALYVEALGHEMGMYETKYDRLGQYSSEMNRAIRLVVDTGMHAKKWTEEEAVQYMLDNSFWSESQIRSEIRRYIAIPGQACAYKVGELELLKYRKRAEKALGEHFDLKEFHAVILKPGNAPLNVVDQIVKTWVELKLAVIKDAEEAAAGARAHFSSLSVLVILALLSMVSQPV